MSAPDAPVPTHNAEYVRRELSVLTVNQDFEWHIEADDTGFFTECWADGCAEPPTWWLQHFKCSSPWCGRHPNHPRHRTVSEHYCDHHALARNGGPLTNDRWSDDG